MMHRYYDPRTGRLINRDPIGYNGGVNLYGYAGGNPVNRIDPDGTSWFGDMWDRMSQPADLPAPTQAEINERWFGRPHPSNETAGLDTRGAGPLERDQSHAVHKLGGGMGQTFEAAAPIIPIPGVQEEELVEELVAAEAISWKGFSPKQLAVHFQKHVTDGKEFGAITQNQYLKAAKDFAAETSASFQQGNVGNFVIKYDPATRRLLVGRIDTREIRTFYRADHRSPDPFQAAVDEATHKRL